MNMYTTLNLVKKHQPCTEGYRKLRRALGKGWGADRKIPLVRILETNGLADALWALRAVPDSQKKERDRISCVFGIDCAERVLPLFEAELPTDDRPRKAIQAAKAFTGHAAGAATMDINDIQDLGGIAGDTYDAAYYSADNGTYAAAHAAHAAWAATLTVARAANAADTTIYGVADTNYLVTYDDDVDASYAAAHAIQAAVYAATDGGADDAERARQKEILQTWQEEIFLKYLQE